VIPIQLVLSPQLAEEKNLWLKSLTNQLQGEEKIGRLVKDFQKHTNNIWYKSVMNMIVRANLKEFQEVKEMSLCEALEELMHDELEECRKKGWDDKEREVISKMQKNGFSQEKIAQILEIPLKNVLAVK